MGENHVTAEPEKTIVTGTVERIVFRNEENGYTVCAIQPARRAPEMIVAGSCGAVWVGELLKAEGHWLQHPRFGSQFIADTITCVPPLDPGGIEKYLGSGIIRGIGKVMAERLVKKFGTDTLRIIDKESGRLREVEGIGEKRREDIRKSWNEQHAIRDIMIFLQSHNVGVAQGHRIYKYYGDQAIAMVQANPYRLNRDIWGIGFKSADKIASTLGIPFDSPLRARAGIIHVLETLNEEGDCYTPHDELAEAAETLLGISKDKLEQAITDEIASRRLIEERGNIYLAAMHEAERGVAHHIRRLLRTAPPESPLPIDAALSRSEQRMGIAFAPGQRDALRMALTHKVSIITGGPGVGKTTLVKALVDVFQARRRAVFLGAPTGRAAKRLEESTGREAKTLHRLLKFNPATRQFDHDRASPLPADVLILDETSMIDITLMHSVLRALPDKAWLVLVGDVDQLPSVGPGNVLRDLIDSGAVPCARLSTIFRQGQNSWIVRNAHRVNQGEPLEMPPREKGLSDFYFIEQEEPEELIRSMISLITDRIPARFKLNPRSDVQVLTPMRKNQLGSENLNRVLQEAMNPKGAELERFGRRYRAGDRVIQIRNNYEKNVFNGDIGLIDAVDAPNQKVTVDYEGSKTTYEAGELDELDLAYACSIHKSQGSEYPAVIILLATQHFKLLQRNLLYTAITRGKKLVCLVGSRKAVYIAIKNDRMTQRRTGLQDRLTGRLETMDERPDA
ncbi:MAG: ATP-dependent RecD-like DNA helicase [Kiritimatiellia bacterium]